MNTIERIEARKDAPTIEPYYAVTRDEWAAIKAVVEAAGAARDWFFAPNSAALSAGKVDLKLRDSLSKLEGE